MIKKKICVVIASRANYGRAKSVLKSISQHKNLHLQLILCASAILDKFGNIENIVKSDGFKIDEKINFTTQGDSPSSMARTTGLGIIYLSQTFERLKPDIVVTIADRYETMSTAIAAAYQNILLAHIQGGEITGSIDESVRHSITKLSHIHFPATEKSKQNIIRMGEDPKFIFNVGCPSIDSLKKILPHRDLKKINNYGVGDDINVKNKYLLVVFHPVTTSYLSSKKEIEILIKTIEKIETQTIWLWPNIDSGSDIISKKLRIYRDDKKRKTPLRLIKHLPVDLYNLILKNSSCLIGNSSSFIREGSYLGTPAVIVGNRQNSREYGENVTIEKIQYDKLIDKIKEQLSKKTFKKSHLYGKGNAGYMVAQILSTIDVKVQKVLKY